MANIFNRMAKRGARKGTGKVKLSLTIDRHQSIGQLKISAKDVVPDSFSTPDLVKALAAAPDAQLSTPSNTAEGDKVKVACAVETINPEDRERYFTGLLGNAQQFAEMEKYFSAICDAEDAAIVAASVVLPPVLTPEPTPEPAAPPADRHETMENALAGNGNGADKPSKGKGGRKS